MRLRSKSGPNLKARTRLVLALRYCFSERSVSGGSGGALKELSWPERRSVSTDDDKVISTGTQTVQ